MIVYITAQIIRRIKKLRLQKRVKQETLGNILGMDRSNYSRKENGQVPLTIEELFKIAQFLEVDPQALMLGEIPDDLKGEGFVPFWRRVPVLNEVRCGEWADCTDLDYPAGHADDFTSVSTDDPNAFVVIAKGDSMIGGKIDDGDYLLVEPNKSIQNGNIVLACLRETGKTVKKIFTQESGGVILQPMNPNYDMITLSNERLEAEKAVFYRISQIIKRT